MCVWLYSCCALKRIKLLLWEWNFLVLISEWRFVCLSFIGTISYVLYTLLFQGAEESDMPVASNVSPESNEKNIIPVETVSPSSNVQIPPTTVAPPTSTADDISTLNSLRGVCFIIIFKLWFLLFFLFSFFFILF